MHWFDYGGIFYFYVYRHLWERLKYSLFTFIGDSGRKLDIIGTLGRVWDKSFPKSCLYLLFKIIIKILCVMDSS